MRYVMIVGYQASSLGEAESIAQTVIDDLMNPASMTQDIDFELGFVTEAHTLDCGRCNV